MHVLSGLVWTEWLIFLTILTRLGPWSAWKETPGNRRRTVGKYYISMPDFAVSQLQQPSRFFSFN